MDYTLTVGLEIHAELATRTKMFCGCLNNPDEKRPNTNVCAICLAHPGTLPVINREAVKKVLLVGAALGSRLADYTEFDRKNYFYPDIPKGYQISQYKYPLVSGGSLSGVELTRIHLEEDTGRSQHAADKSLVDFNRAGVPLMELVTEPVINTAEQAGSFARELQLLLRYLGVGEANMEKGEMRVEANISISAGTQLGTKVEVKNLNSFRSVERAISYEFKRQSELLESGGAVVQETRGWDEAKQRTFSQRKKESSHDYRYFPDPDLPKLKISEIVDFSSEQLKEELPELPWQRRERYIKEGLNAEYAEMFASDTRFGDLYDKTVALAPSSKILAANYIGSDIAGLTKTNEAGFAHITPNGLAALMQKVQTSELSSRGAKDAIAEAFSKGGDLDVISSKYTQQSDAETLAAIAQKIVNDNPTVTADYKTGKGSAMQFLIGQGMKESKGSANPQALRRAIEKILG